MSEENKKGINLLPFKIYGAIYLVMMIFYIVGLIGSSTVVTSSDWLKAAFPNGGSTTEELLKDVKPDVATFRADVDYAFDTLKNVPVQIKAGEKVTLPVAAEIALAIESDQKKGVTDTKEMAFPYKEMNIYKAGWFWNINWAYSFTVYNLLGLFMGLYLGLKAPIKKMLGDSATETAEALASAREAKREAAELRAKYEALVSEVEAEKIKLAELLETEKAEEKIKQAEIAEAEAKAILKSVKSSINADIAIAATRLKHEIAEHAVNEAKKILSHKVSEETHNDAVDDFITELEKADL